MKIGAHISIVGGIEKVPIRARQQGCEVFQIFVQSPQTYHTPENVQQEIENFKKQCQKYKFREYYVHAPYLVNLASKNNKIKYGTISLLRRNLERAEAIGARYFMTHLGSARDYGEKKSLAMVAEGLKKILANYKGDCKFLLEMSAGAGAIIGDIFEDLKFILKQIKQQDIGVCFDTAHAFASGYDLRTKKAVTETFKKFEKIIGLGYLKLIHLNDSATDFGSHRDRHTHIGKGKIGLEGIQAIITHPSLKKINFILETEDDLERKNDIKILKQLRHRFKIYASHPLLRTIK